MPAPTGHAGVDLILWLAAFLVALGTVYRYVWPALKAFARGVAGAIKVYKGTQQFIHDWTGAGENPPIPDRLDTIEVELRKTNGGSTLRDLARGANEGVARLESSVNELKGHAKANREGIADLRDQANDLSARFTDLAEHDATQDARITDHRRRNDQTIEQIKSFLEGEHRDALLAREALQASVTELLHMPEAERRERQIGDD